MRALQVSTDKPQIKKSLFLGSTEGNHGTARMATHPKSDMPVKTSRPVTVVILLLTYCRPDNECEKRAVLAICKPKGMQLRVQLLQGLPRQGSLAG
ncbi:hypothetical protein LWI29_029061 [Acer saccharum]|uniref:Uncharacterized protein n=1 Tax=Acer saccharum TaxID=4024 RepID=A0AA39W0R0_ACESA|nr:hypothetical protein LWI29_029061 [Acer saccharum]